MILKIGCKVDAVWGAKGVRAFLKGCEKGVQRGCEHFYRGPRKNSEYAPV